MIYLFVEWVRSTAWLEWLYFLLQVFDQPLFRVFASGLLAFAFVLVFGKPMIRFLTARKIGDAAKFDVAALDEALKSKANTPTMGGVLIAGAILTSTLLLADITNIYVQMAVIVVVWHACVGGIDDWLKLTAASKKTGSRQGLFAWEKMLCLLGIGVLIGIFAYRAGLQNIDPAMAGTPQLAHVLNLPFWKTYESPVGAESQGLIYLNLLTYTTIMTLMMSGMANSVNITDGMDGLASGITLAVALGLVVLCVIAGTESDARQLLVPYVWGSGELAVVAAALAGAVLGFLWWNCSPASVFMGDTGSLCIGGLIGYLAVVIRQEIIVLIMCGVFLAEILSVVIQVGYFKHTRGKRVFRCAPYHWHLHMGGWQEQKIVARLWITTIVLVAIALGSLKLR